MLHVDPQGLALVLGGDGAKRIERHAPVGAHFGKLRRGRVLAPRFDGTGPARVVQPAQAGRLYGQHVQQRHRAILAGQVGQASRRRTSHRAPRVGVQSNFRSSACVSICT